MQAFRPRYLWLVVCVCLWHGNATVAESNQQQTHEAFDVVIAGGSTAAFAAAIIAAEQGAQVALLEPTDWVGGQITSSAVPAIDEAWHQLRDSQGNLLMDVAKVARTPANITPHLRTMLDATGCPGNCWVSRFCFAPSFFLENQLLPLEKGLPNLTVFRNSVVKSVQASSSRIESIGAVQRKARNHVAHNGYDRLPSQDLRDWYSPDDSERFTKVIHTFTGSPSTVFIDATEWGEVLALADAPYLIGVEHQDGGLTGDETLGQAITYDFVQELHETPNPNRDAEVPEGHGQQLGLGGYRDKPDGWKLVWTYRRLVSSGKTIQSGDLSLQNWGYYPEHNETGNDYPFGYLFLNRASTAAQRPNWIGGIDLDVLAAAEQHAFAWHHFFKSRAPDDIDRHRISLAKHVLGTGHGLAKLPYIRDTRRSIGLDNFLLTVNDLQPTATGSIARTFEDRIALGAYPVDIHRLADRDYPGYIDGHYDIAPFTIPFRALTNQRYGNLLVAGKTMAQSFLANSATRLHPIEWSTGTAAGVIATIMQRENKTTRDVYREIDRVQLEVRKHTPIDWTLSTAP